MIRVVCGCGRVFKAEVRHSGKRTRCPACGAGLVIGQTPVSDSGEGEMEELPSWWYPSDPSDVTEVSGDQPGGDGDPENAATAVLEHGVVAEPGPPGGPKAPEPTTTLDVPAASRSGWPVATAVALTAALAIAAVGWMWRTDPFAGVATATKGPRADDVGRGAGPGATGERNDAPLLDDHPSAGRTRGGRPNRPARRLSLLVPAYIYPNGDGRAQWRRLIDAAGKVDLVAIVNPESGPGLDRNSDYAAIIAEAADRGLRLVGYINTQYAARPTSEVKSDVDAWVRFYPRIAGFFLDQQPADARHSAYVADIGSYAKTKLRGALVITNPGMPCDESYLARPASDLVCVFANFEGFASFELPGDLQAYPPSRFAALAHQVPDAATMRNMVKEAIIKRIGCVYFTDGKAPNPWNRLPTYWEAEVDTVARLQ